MSAAGLYFILSKCFWAEMFHSTAVYKQMLIFTYDYDRI